MFPRHETAFIHYKGSTVINLGIDFTSRDLVDNYGLRAMQHAQRGEYRVKGVVKLGFLRLTQQKKLPLDEFDKGKKQKSHLSFKLKE